MHATRTLSSLLLLTVGVAAQAPGGHWSLTLNSGNPPLRRENPGAASDTHMYVFGGISGGSGGARMNDLWQFDGAAWTQMNADGDPAAPPARSQAGVTWDPAIGKLIVFGGLDTGGAALGDVWTWEPGTNIWTNTTPAGGPGARRYHAMSYDPNTGGVLVFGGLDGSGVHQNDTWLLIAGSAWLPMTPTTVPSTRRQHHMVTRPEFGDVLMFGGQDATLSAPAKWRVDTFRWDGADWSLVPTTQGPNAQVANDAAYDVLRQRVVLVGGNGTGGSPTGIVSEFDSITNDWVWRPLDPGVYKVSRYFAAYVPALGRTYKVSGQALNGATPGDNTYEFQTDVLADAVAHGAGCSGPGGALTLTADNRPWTERTFSATCSNLGAASLALPVWGTIAQMLPLGPLLPQAGAGCIASNDASVLGGAIVPTAGTATVSLPIPAVPALSGFQLELQVAEVELDASLNWVGLYTSNGLTLTIGAL